MVVHLQATNSVAAWTNIVGTKHDEVMMDGVKKHTMARKSPLEEMQRTRKLGEVAV